MMGQTDIAMDMRSIDQAPFIRWIMSVWVSVPVLIGMGVVSLAIGRYPVPWSDLYHLIMTTTFGVAGLAPERYDELKTVVFDLRLPRVFAAMLIGAALSVSGAAFQAMFRNPLVSPGLLGVLAGASFGAAAAMLVGDSWVMVQLGAFLMGLAAVGITLLIARFYGADSLLMLVLGGIITGGLFTALLSIVKALADPYDQLPAIVFWLMGRLSLVDLRTVLLLAGPMILGTVALMASAKYLNALSMGDEEAHTLGVNVTRIRLSVIACATLVSALTVTLAGMIVWVGLVIPHIARLLVGANNQRVLPASAVIGALFLLCVDDLARSLFAVEVPIGVATELIGIPVFVAVLRHVRSGWLS
ncbi:MAG: FecCD family ABC transporter permease [Nitrospiraceae bacterium]